MKKNYALSLFLLCSITVSAQVKTPQPSPAAKIEQTVGLTKIEIKYSRPSISGREIFGDLVPYDKLWRTGANENTKINFEDNVTFGGVPVEAGEYALYTIPREKTWDIILYGSSDNWGTPKKYDETMEIAKVQVPTEKIPFPTETFTILFSNLTNNSTQLSLLWAITSVSIEIGVPTETKTLESIKSTIDSRKMSEGDYFNAASYHLNTKKDLTQALEWIDKAVDMTKDKPKFWYFRAQALIYAAIGKEKKAIKIAKKSLNLAKEAGNMDYVRMNENSIKEWEK